MPFVIGLNFRATSTFVTDGTNETYATGADTYPTTRGGVTFGISGGFVSGSQDRDAGIDRRLAGIIFKGNAGAQVTFRVDLPSPGDYDIRIALGDAGGAQLYEYLELLDNTTSKFIIDDSGGTAAAHFDDATGTDYSAAAWPGNNIAVRVTFASTILNIKFATPTSQTGFSSIAHLGITEVVAPSVGASLFRGRNFRFFDDEEVNRFEFWPAVAVGGQTPATSPAGTIALSGSVRHASNKQLAATLNSSGTVVKTANKPLGAAVGSAGIASPAKQSLRTSTAAITPAASLKRLVAKVVTSTVVSSGTLRKTVGTISAGTITSSGDVARLKVILRVLSRTLSSAASLKNQISAFRAGQITGSGLLQKRVDKRLSGSTSLTGTVANLKVLLRVVAGTIASAGALVNLVDKRITAGITYAGALVRSITQKTGGSLGPTGHLRKVVSRSIAGSIASSGTLRRLVSKTVAATITFSGSVAQLIGHALASNIILQGTLRRQASKSLSGTETPVGVNTNIKTFIKTLVAVVGSVGSTAKARAKSFAGIQASTGLLAKAESKSVTGTVTSSGEQSSRKVAVLNASGNVIMLGSVTRRALKALRGAITSVGSLLRLLLGQSTRADGVSGDYVVTRASTGDFATSKQKTGDMKIGGIKTGDSTR